MVARLDDLYAQLVWDFLMGHSVGRCRLTRVLVRESSFKYCDWLYV